MSSCSIRRSRGALMIWTDLFWNIGIFCWKYRIDCWFSVLLKLARCLSLAFSVKNIFRNEKFFTPPSLVFYPIKIFQPIQLLVCGVREGRSVCGVLSVFKGRVKGRRSNRDWNICLFKVFETIISIFACACWLIGARWGPIGVCLIWKSGEK